MKKDKDSEVFKKYLVGRKILVVDPSSSARSGIFKVFSELGAKPSQLVLSSSFQDAINEIDTHKPDIVISEYDLGKSCGLELMQNQRKHNPDAKKILFVLLTGNTSQSAVARAAEEDIDSYVLKPFTPEVLRKTILQAAILKLKPPPYYVAIDEGKDLLKENKIDEAEAKFKEAAALDPKPSLALYYLGQVKFLRKVIDQANGSYRKGLEFNKIHYKCLIGLYELLMDLKRHEEAYEVVKRVSQYFPANPKRLAEVLRLAIINGKYEDVEKYYSIFCNIDERSDELIRYICAALVVCGKYYLQTQNRSRALELFQKAGVTSAGRTKILKEIIQNLVEYGISKEASEFLKRFPPETQSGADYQLLNFQILALTGSTAQIIAQGQDLMQKGFFNEKYFEIMISKSLEGKLGKAAENYAYQAVEKFPKLSDHFKGYLDAEKKKHSTAA